MIERLPDPGCLGQQPVTKAKIPELKKESDSQHIEVSNHNNADERNIDTEESYDTANTKMLLPDDDAKTELMDKTTTQMSTDDDTDDDDDDETDIGPSNFDDLEWEVECTPNVWKLLNDKKVPKFLKRSSITKIKHLAKGEWTLAPAKKLDCVSSDIQLYETKLSEEACIVWELAVAFSPRRSEDADRRLGANASDSGVKGGCIYAEKHLKGIQQKYHTGSGAVQQRIPNLYVEIDNDGKGQNSQMKDAELAPVAQQYFPPASPNETEYHIMKFYAFTSTLVTNILADQETKVDFPFRVTELEHAIIHLQRRPPTAILLLGRSGTGKTTCCVYRLWNAFVRYWEKATAAAAPLMPRKVFYNNTQEDECDMLKVESNMGESSGDTSNELVLANAENGGDTGCATETHGWDHLHQIFVTKNPVLCREVQKNFSNMSHASNIAQHHTAVELDELPNRLQDVRSDVFPLFLTMRRFLLMLDGSMLEPYFERESDGSLAREVTGWGDNNNQLSFIPDVNFDDDTNDIVPLDGVSGDDTQAHTQHTKKRDPRREVTYEVFVHELWPKMNKKLQLDCHATLVWMEIRSFIQGSFEALMSEMGYLSLDEYLLLGRKRAANFNSDRSAIYDLYKEYRRLKQNLSMYDENDLVHHLYHRLTFNGAAPEWVVHEFYVDETQDFTQAELCLLIRCAADPNATFFTGDTAQSIMRGIAFRFEDLRSIFFYAQESFRCQDKASTIQVPRLYQLTHNYRSHAGILALAASIVDLLIEFFPNSFDRLEKDCGLFEGPKPVLLESCSVSDLALLLRGSQRQTSQIEFGAHQAILVANDQAREHIPEELSLGLVLTIFEAKGLEFDDILLYNFFKDSQANQEWRVVTEHLNTLLEQQQIGGATNTHNAVVEIDPSVVDSDDRPRPLTFDPDQHKVLNSELKYLYTALTRARVNVWIFDEDANARAPMFEYFRACHLVEVVAHEGADFSEQELPDRVFAEASTHNQWRQRGDEFYKHHLYNVAAKCYMKSGDVAKEKMSRAQQRALEASRLRDNPRKLRHEFLFAAEGYLDCGMTTEAAKCLCNAKETLLAAQLYEKMGQSHHAVALYKKLGRMDDASQAYENDSKYGQAVELLVSAKLFDKAIDVVSRYHIKIQEYEKQGLPVPTKMLTNRPGSETRSVKQLCLEAAEFHLQGGHIDDMLGSLDRLPDVTDKIQFLLQRGHVKLAAPIMEEHGRASEAAEAFYEAGELEMALQYASAESQLSFRAECLLSASRHIMSHDESSDDEQCRAEKYLLEALSLFLIIGDRLRHDSAEAKLLLGRSAETKLLLGRLTNDSSKLTEAYTMFYELHNDIGQIMCTKDLLDQHALHDNDDSCSKCLRCLQMLFDLVAALECAKNALEKDQTQHVRQFYGLQDTDKRREYRLMHGQGARINACIPVKIRSMSTNTLEEKHAHDYIISDLVAMVPGIVSAVRGKATDAVSKNRSCEQYLSGLACDDCSRQHFVATQEQCKHLARAIMWLVQLDVLIAATLKCHFMGKLNLQDRKILKDLETKRPDKWLHEFYQVLFPIDGRVSDVTVEFVRSIRENTRVWYRIMDFTEEWLWKTLDHENRQANTDNLIMIHNIRLICQPNLENLNSLLLQEEKWYKEHKSRSPPDLGIHKACGLIYFRKYIEGAMQLYRKRDPVEAFACLNMLLHFTARRPRAPLLPSIANAAMILEQQVILAACLCLHFRSGTAVLLPECYLSAVKFRDALHTRKSTVGLYNIVHQYTGQWLGPGRVISLVEIMCGYINDGFDMIADVLGSDDLIKSGECERVLILVLVMLSNAGFNKPIPLKAENLLRERLAAVSFSDGLKIPSRLATALSEIKAASCKRDVVLALRHLLEKRDPKAPLRKCVWNRTWGGLTVQQVADVSAIDDDRMYKPYKCAPSQPPSNTDGGVVAVGKTEDEPADGEDLEKDFFTDECIQKAQTDQEQLDIESATPQEQDGATSQATTPELQRQSSAFDPFDYFVIDDTLCNVCYVKLAPSVEPVSPGGESLHPRLMHEESREHMEKQRQFDVYKQWVLEDVQPVLHNARSLSECDAPPSALFEVHRKLHNAEQQLRSSRKYVEVHRCWNKLEEMAEAVRGLQECIYEAKSTIDRINVEQEQRTRLEAETRKILGEDQGALQADDDQYKDDEARPLMKVAEGPKLRKGPRKPRRQRWNNGRSSGRRN
ncbi:TPR and ankyrin repeat-containing protein 1 [Lamellibrachia satsuma]|nr:TPR and ankyrin repeat-containing protein 1 [Lamellibrachia satsuma]